MVPLCCANEGAFFKYLPLCDNWRRGSEKREKGRETYSGNLLLPEFSSPLLENNQSIG